MIDLPLEIIDYILNIIPDIFDAILNFRLICKEFDNIIRNYFRIKYLTCKENYSGEYINKQILTNLIYLDYQKWYHQIECVEKLTKLVHLNCSFSKIKKINNKNKLTYLNCVNCKNITYVNNFILLTYLNCSYTGISDVSKLIYLKYLNCSDTNIADVSMLMELENLNCKRTKIADVSTLIKLTSLNCVKTLVQNVNMLTNLKILKYGEGKKTKTKINKLTHLTYLHMFNNPHSSA